MSNIARKYLGTAVALACFFVYESFPRRGDGLADRLRGGQGQGQGGEQANACRFHRLRLVRLVHQTPQRGFRQGVARERSSQAVRPRGGRLSPREKLPDELKAENAKLAKKYNIHGYPSILADRRRGRAGRGDCRLSRRRPGEVHGNPGEAVEAPRQRRRDAGRGARCSMGSTAPNCWTALIDATDRTGQRRRQAGGLDQGDRRFGPRQQGGPEDQVRVPPVDGRSDAADAPPASSPRPAKKSRKPLPCPA